MPQKLIGLMFVLVFVLGLVSAAPTPATAVPAGLTPTDWGQIQRQLPPQAVAAWHEQTKLTGNDSTAFDRFGVSVAVSGDTAVVGAPYNDADTENSNRGSAYVFTRTGTAWSLQAKLTADDAAANDNFGWSVAISGDTAVIGAVNNDEGGSDSGAAYVFTRTGTMWSQQAKLTASNPAIDDAFGYAVALHNDTAVIGVSGDNDEEMLLNNSGSAYIFSRSGSTWSEQAKLTASDAGADDQFGHVVAISGDTAVIGAYRNDGEDDEGTIDNSGSAYIFVRSGESWSEQAKLTASDAGADDQFGGSVAISGDTAVIGADYDDDGFTNSGSVYIFSRSGGAWSEQAKLTASDPAEFDYFGYAVAISGDTAVIGMFFDDDGGPESGSAYIFRRSEGVWSEQAKLTASDSAAGDYFGASVAISGDTAVIGAPLDGDGLDGLMDTGSAYIFSTQQILTIVTAGDGQGQVQSDPAGNVFAQGTMVTLTAVASPGSHFTGWSGDVITTTNPLPLTMDSHKTITATFTLDETPPPGFVIYLPLVVR